MCVCVLNILLRELDYSNQTVFLCRAYIYMCVCVCVCVCGIGYLKIHGIHETANNSSNNNVVFFFVSDLKIVYYSNY